MRNVSDLNGSFPIEKTGAPFDVPDSIKELALRPLIPKLLRLCPFPACLISLFRRMTGVSAKGSAIFDVAP